MLSRVLAVLAAALLVGAFAVATLAPPDLPLGQALLLVNHDWLPAARASIQHDLSPWIWSQLVTPLLQRPAWLVPAALGLVAAGVALTLASNATRHSHRRRS